jgi:tRNA threonylcarbamoyladenosine biosynthesis protein TsaB
VPATAPPRLLIIETSGRIGQVGLALGPVLLSVERLDESRRHARDLAPAVAKLLAGAAWKPRDVHGIVVSRGPGSYTGLRVGIMSAKALAYAACCPVIGVETFAAIAHQAPENVSQLDVIADAQQQKVYLQRFGRAQSGSALLPLAPLAICDVSEWLGTLSTSRWVSGPGLHSYQQQLQQHCQMLGASEWDPQLGSLSHLGFTRYACGEHDDLWSLEPLYLRPSSAEEKWTAHSAGTTKASP